MTRAIGIDPADDLTRWAVATGNRVLASGRVRSTVTVGGIDVDHVVDRLGRAEPIVVGGVPYGAEALLGRLLAATVEGARGAHGELVVAVVHDDDLDDYRRSLLVEATRVGEVGPVVLVARSTAVEAAAAHRPDDEDLTAAVGAALWLADQHGGGGIGPGAAIAGGGVVGLAAGAVVSTTGGGGPASAAAATAGPTGTPLTTAAGPTGTPLTTAAGPAGTPLTPAAGPTGTALTTAAGPTGTVLTAAAASATARRIPIGAAVAAGVAVVAVVTGVIVAVTRGGDAPAVRPADSVLVDPSDGTASPNPGTAASASATTAPVTVPVEPTTPTSSNSSNSSNTAVTDPAAVDVSTFVGSWQGECDPFIDGSGGASGSRYEVTQTGPGSLEFAIVAMLYTGGCGTPGVEEGRLTFSLAATGESTVDGVPVVVFDGSAGATDIAMIPPDMLAAQTWFLGVDDRGLRISEDGVGFLPITGGRE